MDNFVQFLLGSSGQLDAEFIARFFTFLIVINAIVSIAKTLSKVGGR